jgi:dipeptidyl aminopeptidase/acylaminoacyl peptidase
MKFRLPFVFFLTLSSFSFAQNLAPLTIEKIMRDPKWMGTQPSNPQWSIDGKTLYFNWNPEKAPADSLYFITVANKTPQKATVQQKQNLVTAGMLRYNKAKTLAVYTKDGDIYLYDVKQAKARAIVKTIEFENNPQFSFNETKIVYNRNQNLFAWDIASGETEQLINTQTGSASSPKKEILNQQEQWLKDDQLQYFEVLKERKQKRELGEAYNKSLPKNEIRKINLDDKQLQQLNISPDGRFICYNLFKAATSTKTTIVPNYVTESGFTTDIPTRAKVGEASGTYDFFVYDSQTDTVLAIKMNQLLGIKDLPDYVKDYPKQLGKRTKENADRIVSVNRVTWNPSGKKVMLEIYSYDNKDRWLMLLNPANGNLELISRQRDEAWIGGPGITSFGATSGWIDDNQFWYQSEKTGYSHLYIANATTKESKQITTGNYEVQQVNISNDKKYFYITTNEINPGEKHLYKINIDGSGKEKLTSWTGANNTILSPDEKNIALLYSSATKPWELFLVENKKNSSPQQITNKAQSDEFKTYSWKEPEVITFKARDGEQVYGRLYKPANPHPTKPAVIFVHGAGYLQNAHKWWSQYFREYMFHNLLADNGYTVLDIDYRASAGYGRNWRTGIYRHMGGKDLTDNVDAADYLVKNLGVDAKRIGVYGGSYGGFITLMALFTTPDVFAAGAALRPVTDWANYNHGYTSNILNEPFTDSIAYRKSSPYYFADGLKNNLLICHGMVDVNVHYQDAVKLQQRLIELGKDNWEMASYPMEDHGFVEPSSWIDEYKRIFKLFETVLKK